MISPRGALSQYRVLDLSTARGFLCGKIFADQGADVVKIEPPGGDEARSSGPFQPGLPHPEASLPWRAFNTSKRGITLNFNTAEGQIILKRLAETADFLIESFDPGYLDGLGLGYDDLSQVNPRLIMGSITPFGQSGPRSRWKGPDIIPWAMSGYMWMTGDPERAPLRISQPPQAYLHASTVTVVGMLLALHHRTRTGRGQHIDTSAQQCPTWMLTHTYAYWDMLGIKLARAGVFRQFGPTLRRNVWPCKDGYVVFVLAGGLIGAKGQRRLVEIMDKAGMAPSWLRDFEWEEWSATGQQDTIDRIIDAVGRFFRAKTKAELFGEALRNDIMLAPVNTVSDLMESPQLKDRDYWTFVDDSGPDAAIAYPGAPCKMDRAPWRVRRRAPHPGEHNQEVYAGEMGFTEEQILSMKRAGVI